jgi:hypothetical protein
MIEHLRSIGTQRLVGIVLQENGAMRALVHDCGFVVVPSRHEPHAIRYVLDLGGAAPDIGVPAPELAMPQ